MPPPRKPRRAAVDVDGRKFTRVASVRYTADQYEALEARAAFVGLPVGTLIRVNSLRGVELTPARVRQILLAAGGNDEGLEMLRDVLRELRRRR